MKSKRRKRVEESETGRRIRAKKRRHFWHTCLALLKLCLLAALLVALGFGLREAYGWGRGVFDRYYAVYQDYRMRRSEQRKELDERFDGYTNVLVLGLDEGTQILDEATVAEHRRWEEKKASVLTAREAWEKERVRLQEEKAKEQSAREADKAKEGTKEENAGKASELEEQMPDFSVPPEPEIRRLRIGQQADTIMVFSLNNTTGDLRVISVPRGTLVDVPELKQKQARLNGVFAEGGSTLMVKTVSRELGISLHHYVELDTELLAQLIDTLGGIDIYVETDMYYEDPESGLKINIPQGFRHMDGETVQKYLRYRSGELGDVGRLQRQQRFVRSAFETVLKPANVTKLPQLAELVQHKLSTSAEIWDTAHLLKVLHSIQGTPQTIMLPGSSVKGDESSWLLDRAAVDAKIKELFPELLNNN